MSTIETLRANLAAAEQREAEANRILAATAEDDPNRHLVARAACAAWIGVGHHQHKLWLYTNHPETWAAMQPK
jgi:hypothetical protein